MVCAAAVVCAWQGACAGSSLRAQAQVAPEMLSAREDAMRAVDQALQALSEARGSIACRVVGPALGASANALECAQEHLQHGSHAEAAACAYVAQRRAQRATSQARLHLSDLRAQVALAGADTDLNVALGLQPSAGSSQAPPPWEAMRRSASDLGWHYEASRGLVLPWPVTGRFDAASMSLTPEGREHLLRLLAALSASWVAAVRIESPQALVAQAQAVAQALTAAGVTTTCAIAPRAPASEQRAPPHLAIVVADPAP